MQIAIFFFFLKNGDIYLFICLCIHLAEFWRLDFSRTATAEKRAAEPIGKSPSRQSELICYIR
jgi:hypothetical protein